MKRTAQAHWQGDLKNGAGALTTASHTLNNTPAPSTPVNGTGPWRPIRRSPQPWPRIMVEFCGDYLL
jgi:hypothetical protein